jgi:hypothetical protein
MKARRKKQNQKNPPNPPEDNFVPVIPVRTKRMNGIIYGYNARGQLVSIKDCLSRGRVTEFVYDADTAPKKSKKRKH